MLEILMKGLRAEFDSVLFYLEKLERLNYKDNKQAVDSLTLESVDHALWLTKEILLLKKDVGGKLDSLATREAMREEMGMREIYAYELEKSDDVDVKVLMTKLIKEEKHHERLVDSLR
ncbi:hypothetical protein GOV10_01965 [Candidatus Woesearchaeota archaeon]|nr:hypothetical protein [Candidatus Woesearchaeota archaeon]